MDKLLTKISDLRKSFQPNLTEGDRINTTNSVLVTDRVCSNVERTPAPFVEELSAVQGNVIVFSPAGTGLDTHLFSQAVSTLTNNQAQKVIFAGNSLGFLNDLYSRLQSVVFASCKRFLQGPSAEECTEIAKGNQVLFVTYEVLQSLVASDIVRSEDIALIILDNVFDAEELDDTFMKLLQNTGSTPKVLAVVPALFANNLEDVADVCTTLQTCSSVLQANLAGPCRNLAALEGLLHQTKVELVTVDSEPDDLQIGLLTYCRELWELVKQSVELSSFSEEEMEEVVFEPGKLEVLLQLHGSDSSLPVGHKVALQQLKTAMFSHRLLLDASTPLCLSALDKGLAELESALRSYDSSSPDALLNKLAEKLSDQFWSNILGMVTSSSTQPGGRFQTLKETLAKYQLCETPQRLVLLVTEDAVCHWLKDALCKDEVVRGLEPTVFGVSRQAIQDAWADGESQLVILHAEDLAECGLEGASAFIRYSPVSAAQLIVESRIIGGLGCSEFVVLSSDEAGQQREVQQLRDNEDRLKAAMQLLMHGGISFYHALQQLSDAHSEDLVQPYAQTALELYCLHAHGKVPEYQVTKLEPMAEQEPVEQFTATVELPGVSGTSTGDNDVRQFTGAVSQSEDAALQSAAVEACRQLYHQGTLKEYFGLKDDEEVEEDDVIPRGMELLRAFSDGMRLVEKSDSSTSNFYTPFQDSAAPDGVSMEAEQQAEGHRRKQLQCRICNVRATNSWNFESHLLGRKHNRRVAALREEHGSAACQLALHGSDDDGDDDDGDDGEAIEGSEEVTTTRHADNPQVPLVTIEKGNRRIFMCPICGVSATSARNYVAHIQGKSHLKNVRKAHAHDLAMDDSSSSASHSTTAEGKQEGRAWADPDINKQMEEVTKALQELGHSMPDMTEMPFKCELCGIYTTSEQLMEGHLQGRKHLKRVAMLQGGADGSGHAAVQRHMMAKTHVSTPFYCDVCDIYATSDQQLEMHYAGKRHQQAAGGRRGTPRPRRMKGGERMQDEGMAFKAEFKCEVCGVVSPNLQQLEYHYRGQRHQRRLRQQQTLHQGGQLAVYAAGSCDVRDLTMRKLSTSDILRLQALHEEQRPSTSAAARSGGATPHPPSSPSSGSGAASGPPSSRHTPGGCSTAPDGSTGAKLSYNKHLKNGSRGAGEPFVVSTHVVRQPSGNVYDNFPCVRVGDYVLPSSMDLRAYLEEVQVGVGQTILDGEACMGIREVLQAASGNSLKGPLTESVQEESCSAGSSSKASPAISPSTRNSTASSSKATTMKAQPHSKAGTASRREGVTASSSAVSASYHGSSKSRHSGYRPFHPAKHGPGPTGYPASPSAPNEGQIPAVKDCSQPNRRHNRKGGSGVVQPHLGGYRAGPQGDMSIHEEWAPAPHLAAASPLVPLAAPPPQYLVFPQFYQQPPGQAGQFLPGPWWSPQPPPDFSAKQLPAPLPQPQPHLPMPGALHSAARYGPGIAYPSEGQGYDMGMHEHLGPSQHNMRWGHTQQRNMF